MDVYSTKIYYDDTEMPRSTAYEIRKRVPVGLGANLTRTS